MFLFNVVRLIEINYYFTALACVIIKEKKRGTKLLNTNYEYTVTLFSAVLCWRKFAPNIIVLRILILNL